MAKNRSQRIKAEQLDIDLKVVSALQQLSDYTPLNKNYSAKALAELRKALEEAKQNELNHRNAALAAYDARVAVEWAIHDGALGAKDQVIAQYGPDSDAVQSLGLKKKSKYRRPVSRSTKSA